MYSGRSFKQQIYLLLKFTNKLQKNILLSGGNAHRMFELRSKFILFKGVVLEKVVNYKRHYKLRFISCTGLNFNQLYSTNTEYIRQNGTVRDINDTFLVKFNNF